MESTLSKRKQVRQTPLETLV